MQISLEIKDSLFAGMISKFASLNDLRVCLLEVLVSK